MWFALQVTRDSLVEGTSGPGSAGIDGASVDRALAERTAQAGLVLRQKVPAGGLAGLGKAEQANSSFAPQRGAAHGAR